ncbi:hypothetical protein ITI46_07765 [Streptomyces oryzae]|uniref:Uncharacterized protein n=1 Tax=Streptomyces oryzae TaxID=1434886 RepID=A0ABS3X8C6_9ACTN|nr:hypothetical protein [Streptomyces oryzae]MBO8191589.1 hypothetical protein [Streptomyces oryzae]
MATLLAMLIIGGADHRVVEMPGPDGSTGFAIVEASAADNPEKLREIRESLHRWAAEREAIDAEWTVSPVPASWMERTDELSAARASR